MLRVICYIYCVYVFYSIHWIARESFGALSDWSAASALDVCALIAPRGNQLNLYKACISISFAMCSDFQRQVPVSRLVFVIQRSVGLPYDWLNECIGRLEIYANVRCNLLMECLNGGIGPYTARRTGPPSKNPIVLTFRCFANDLHNFYQRMFFIQ